MKIKITSVKNHVHNHRAKYAFAAGFTTCFAITASARKQWNEFLTEHDLLDTFYTND